MLDLLTAIAASLKDSLTVGWAKQVRATSSALPPYSMWAQAAAIISEAPLATIWTPRSLSVLAQAMTLTKRRLVKSGQVLVRSTAGDRTLETKNILIATGSVPVELPFMKFDGETVISSDHGISLKAVPEKMVVVGAGAIGLELGSVWARLGSQVTVVEMLPSIGGPAYDADVAKAAQNAFEKQGIKFELGAKVTGVKKSAAGSALTAERDGKALEFPADKILVAVGRKANTTGLGAQEAGLKLDERGRIVIDAHFQTNLPGVYAIGDVVTGPMLAHKAEE
ncbi:MAG: hypothetical protein EBV31_08885, partial [Verrucomicrobia bacterium]|nr:hypothetical protein [Verrucomicrobiota bacterium]